MEITGQELLFLVQALQDSLRIERGYDWVFKASRDKRASFCENIIMKAISGSNTKIIDLGDDVSHL